jgi:hypothetical protein
MNETTAKSSSVLESPWLFFGVVYAWTWLFWLTAAFLGLGMNSSGVILLLLGIAGPTIAGITFTYLTKDKAGAVITGSGCSVLGGYPCAGTP